MFFFIIFVAIYIDIIKHNLINKELIQMEDIQRIRKLENRMRKPSKLGCLQNQANEESLKTIKSTDSKKYNKNQIGIVPQEKFNEVEAIQHSSPMVLFNWEDVKNNKKITDYFRCEAVGKAKPAKTEAMDNQKKWKWQDQGKTDLNVGEVQLRQENRTLREKVRAKEEDLMTFRNNMKKVMIDQVMTIHRMRRNQMRLRVSTNKIRLGEYISFKKGQEVWIDGTQIREIKEKIELINKEKQELEKSKKAQTKRTIEDQQERRNTIACQAHFLSREQAHLQQILKRLQQEKALHIKQYKLLFEEEHSRYGKIDPNTGITTWPQIKQYQLLGLLGRGGFSEVYKAYDCQQFREVACKVHQFNSNWNDNAKQNYIKHALRENKVHKLLIHPNIVRLYDTVEIDNTSFCTVLEYCEGPDLSYYIKKHKRIPEKEAKMILRQVVLAIKYLHQLDDKVIHYDLKPQNIMFHKGKIKITDFGLCKTTKEEVIELTSQGVGTYWYLPPQCFVTDEKAHITPKVDIWSIGVIYFEMVYGEKPFGNQMSQIRILNEGIMLKATQVNFPQVAKGLVSNESKQFIKACLTWQVQDRIDILGVCNHSIFQKK